MASTSFTKARAAGLSERLDRPARSEGPQKPSPRRRRDAETIEQRAEQPDIADPGRWPFDPATPQGLERQGEAFGIRHIAFAMPESLDADLREFPALARPLPENRPGGVKIGGKIAARREIIEG
jgi:hypothetical protein